jgi:hypothetical protein
MSSGRVAETGVVPLPRVGWRPQEGGGVDVGCAVGETKRIVIVVGVVGLALRVVVPACSQVSGVFTQRGHSGLPFPLAYISKAAFCAMYETSSR